jgi:hypothetical protein
MNRTKFAALLAAIALTLFAVGCGGGDSANNANSGNATRSNTNAANK